MYRPKILVVGSFVKDLIVTTRKFPDKGETVLGCDFHMATGGKGANQAIQAARLGAQVTMVGKVGSDAFGKDLIDACFKNGIDCSKIMIDPRHPSSVGNVQLLVDESGMTQNRIIVVPGANMGITPAEVQFLRTEIDQYDMVLLQLEIPMEINELVAEYACQKGVPVMLNAAPSDIVSPEMLSRLTYISLNESEAQDMTGIPVRVAGRTADQGSVQTAIRKLLDKGVKNVLITLGTAGAAFGNESEFFLIPALDNTVSVDPTGAGDAFIGAFSTFVSMGIDNRTAVRLANYVGSLTVSVMGAQSSLPSLEQVSQLVLSRGEEDLLMLAGEASLCG